MPKVFRGRWFRRSAILSSWVACLAGSVGSLRQLLPADLSAQRGNDNSRFFAAYPNQGGETRNDVAVAASYPSKYNHAP